MNIVKYTALFATAVYAQTRQQTLDAVITCEPTQTYDPVRKLCMDPPKLTCPPDGGIAPMNVRA